MKTFKWKSKLYRVIQPGERFDGKVLYDEKGKRVKGPYMDAARAEALSARVTRKKKGAK